MHVLHARLKQGRAPVEPYVRYQHMKNHQNAIVIGGGLDALLAARVLIDYFGHVTLAAPEAFSSEPGLPQTIEQALPAHLLAVQGYRSLERLFPGLTAELMVAGAPTVEWTADAVTLLPNGWAPRFHADLITRPVTPNLLHHVIRQRLLEYAAGRLTLLENMVVSEAMMDGSYLSGVRLHGADGSAEEIPAAVIMDASGQHPAWSGYQQPAQTTISSATGFSVCLLQQPAGYQPGWKAVVLFPSTDQTGAVLMPVEGNRWLALLAAPTAPQDSAAFLNLARRLRTPIVYEAIHQATPLTPVFAQPQVQSIRTHYENLTDWPDNLLVMGAGFAQFNPIYGYDLTASAQAAMTLHDTLDDQRKRHQNMRLSGFSQRFFERLARSLNLTWRLLIEPPAAGSLTRRIHDHLLAAAHTRPEVFQHLLAVAGHITTPRALLQPVLLREALRPLPDSTPFDPQPPGFEPSYVHKTITQEISAIVGSKEP